MWLLFGVLVQTGILGCLGEAAIAAHSVATIVIRIISVDAYGFASAFGIIVGKAIGDCCPLL